jgi:hypothetical protein
MQENITIECLMNGWKTKSDQVVRDVLIDIIVSDNVDKYS